MAKALNFVTLTDFCSAGVLPHKRAYFAVSHDTGVDGVIMFPLNYLKLLSDYQQRTSTCHMP